MRNNDEWIERRIITGMIVSTEYLQQVNRFWNVKMLSASSARIIATWCIDYFREYEKAAGRDIEDIYLKQKRKGLSEDKAEWIEDILSSLSEEYEREQFNFEYLLDETKDYFKEQHLKQFAENIQDQIQAGNILDAEREALGYASVVQEATNCINPFASAQKFKDAFKEREKPLIEFPTTKNGRKALGEFWNNELTRGAFVALMAPEKRGKTFMLMELALRAMKCGCNVVFFQAGDMTEAQQLRRLGIYLTKKSDQKRYCKAMYAPVADCTFNQNNTCDKDVRECDFGIYEGDKKKWEYDELIEAFITYPEYRPCYNCNEYKGVIWLKHTEAVPVVTWKEAYKKAKAFQKRYNSHFRLSSYPNESLTVSEIKSLLAVWEQQENFIPDVIIIDYADILAPDPDVNRLDFRNQTNKIWQRLRSLTQEKHCLVITATQAAASSYKQDVLSLTDFSEDKRKYAHVTAMYGLNQSAEQKKMGILQINELLVRDSDFEHSKGVQVLQQLQRGQTFLGSYL